MSRRETDCELRGMLLGESPNAILVCPIHSPLGGRNWWIPRSMIGYMRKDKVESPFAGASANTHVTFTLPENFVEKKQCWELVP